MTRFVGQVADQQTLERLYIKGAGGLMLLVGQTKSPVAPNSALPALPNESKG